jgi:hypothetical protein
MRPIGHEEFDYESDESPRLRQNYKSERRRSKDHFSRRGYDYDDEDTDYALTGDDSDEDDHGPQNKS